MSTTPTFIMPNRPLTWLITGCSSGFGLTLTRFAQSHGHHVIATSRNPSKTPDLVVEIKTKGGDWLTLDVDSPQDCTDAISHIESSGKHVDVLVNNAGYSVFAAVEQLTEEEVRSLMETLYFGPCRLIRAVVPGMRERRFGVVVNMSSGAGLEGRESMGAYAPAKAALDGVSRVLAKEVAPFNVRVLTVWLGTFNTNMAKGNATLGKNPMPEDYKGSLVHKTMKIMSSGKFEPDGDKDKAMKAVYEVVMGVGAGAGREGEKFLPLGRDLAARVKLLQDQFAHCLEVFGEVCNNVYRDK